MAAGAQKAAQSHWSPAVICSAEITIFCKM